MGCSDCFGGFLEVIGRGLGEKQGGEGAFWCKTLGEWLVVQFQRLLGGGFMVEVDDDYWKKVSWEEFVFFLWL